MRPAIALALGLLAACSNPVVGAGVQLEWQPRSYSFPQTPLGSSVTADFTLKNSGSRDVVVTAIRLAPGTSSAFSLAAGGTTATQTLRPRQGIQVTVRYAPVSLAEARGFLRAESAAGPTDAVLSNLPPSPRIELDPPGLDFGVVLQGQRLERELKVRNIGTAPLTVSRIALSPLSHPDFELDLAGTTLPATLDLLQVRKVKVVFAPSGAGVRGGAVEVASDDPRTPLARAPLTSGETSPRISIDPTALFFGEVEPTERKELTLRITNAGTAELRVTPSLSGSTDFQVTPGERVLAPNMNLDLVVAYVPSDVGNDEGVLTLSHNDPSQGPLTVPLRGGANPAIDVSPFGIQFTNVVQFQSAEQEVIVTNVGYGQLVLNRIALGTGPGESHPDYSLVNVPASGTALGRGQSTSFLVRYQKNTMANPLAVIYLESNDPEPSVNPFPLYVLAVEGVNDPPPTAAITCTNCNGSTLQAPLPVPVLLDGSASSDPQGQALSYSWALSSIPAQSQAVLESPTAAQTRFVADRAGLYRVTLIVQDESGQQSPRVTKEVSVVP
jgi:hypothetical protein